MEIFLKGLEFKFCYNLKLYVRLILPKCFCNCFYVLNAVKCLLFNFFCTTSDQMMSFCAPLQPNAFQTTLQAPLWLFSTPHSYVHLILWPFSESCLPVRTVHGIKVLKQSSQVRKEVNKCSSQWMFWPFLVWRDCPLFQNEHQPLSFDSALHSVSRITLKLFSPYFETPKRECTSKFWQIAAAFSGPLFDLTFPNYVLRIGTKEHGVTKSKVIHV